MIRTSQRGFTLTLIVLTLCSLFAAIPALADGTPTTLVPPYKQILADMSTVTTASDANAAMTSVGTGQWPWVPPSGSYNATNKTWDFPSSGYFQTKQVRSTAGLALSFECKVSGPGMFGINCGEGNSNTLCVHTDTGAVDFGEVNPVNPTMAPQYRGETKTGLAPGGTAFRVTMKMGYTPANRISSPDANLSNPLYVHNTDGSLYYFISTDPGTSLVSIPFEATVEELQPTYSRVSYKGITTSWIFNTDGALLLTSTVPTLSFTKIFTSR